VQSDGRISETARKIISGRPYRVFKAAMRLLDARSLAASSPASGFLSYLSLDKAAIPVGESFVK
jgi:hypothetical protein